MDSVSLKHDFAANLLRYPDDPFKAAFATTPETGIALKIAREWPLDPVVQAEQDRLLTTGDAKSFLPTKEAQAKDIYAIATSGVVEVEDRLKAHRLYAEIMGFIEKPVPGTTNNILNQGVMIVKDQGTDDEWEDTALKQQRALTNGSSVN
jgi:hypothetical protein